MEQLWHDSALNNECKKMSARPTCPRTASACGASLGEGSMSKRMSGAAIRHRRAYKQLARGVLFLKKVKFKHS